jgi:hypothetical protein
VTDQTANAGRGPNPGQNRAPACAECGAPPTPGQSFCDSCGAVLSWTPGTGYRQETTDGRRAGNDDTPVHGVAVNDPAEPPAPEPARSAVPFRGVIGARADADSPGAPAFADPEAPTVPTPATAPSDRTAEPLPAGGWEPSAAERARALLIPVTDPEPAAAPLSVAPVLPGRPVSARPQVQGLQQQDDEDGARCPWCGTGNRPDRHFCRRCAMTMDGRPADPARRPWWRRLPGLGVRRVPWAGERPRLRRGLGRVLSWVVGAVALALLVTAALNTGTAVQSVRDHFTKRAPISPDSYRASRSFAGHGPGLAFDKFNNTWWGPGLTESDAGEWVEADFSQPADLLDVVITSGESTLPSDLSKSALPHTIEAVVTTADGRTQNRFLTLDQASGGQTRAFRASDVTSVRFILRSAYGASALKQVAIAEIEFFGPSSGGGS